MLEKVKKLPLNEGQTLASEGFLQFLLGPDKELRITGPGGVGKTFLMGHMIDEIIPMYQETCQMMGIPPEYHAVYMTATTNKAAEVLGLQTGRPTSTVHSHFGLKVQSDFDTGVSKVTKSSAWTVYHNIILFIDEASMIDSDLYDLIHEGTCKCKIVYVGDKDQLAPVKESLSPVYKRPMETFELLEPMRTAIPELQALNAQTRLAVTTQEFLPIQIVPGIIDWLSGEEFEQEIADNFLDPDNDNVILAYTNSRVIEYNSHIREMRGMPAEFVKGEHLISASANRFGKRSISIEDELTILELEDMAVPFEVNHDTTLEVKYATLQNSFGEIITDVPIPVDRAHYDALVKYFKRLKNWRVYYKLKEQLPDLRQRDARTIYKIQGSSVSGTVYIDAANLSTCHNPAQAARLLYVGVSRARKRVAFYDSLATKYGGLIL